MGIKPTFLQKDGKKTPLHLVGAFRLLKAKLSCHYPPLGILALRACETYLQFKEMSRGKEQEARPWRRSGFLW
jgi:hypothetical protein